MKGRLSTVSGGRRVVMILGLILLLVLLLGGGYLFLAPVFEKDKGETVEGSADWMASLPDDARLNELAIPGTHNSAAAFVQMAYFNKCQSKSILKQLEAGFRYLDIRLAVDGDGMKLMHGFTNCRTGAMPWASNLSLDLVLEDCYAFLDAHPTETVLFVVKQEHGDESVAQFQQVLNGYIQKSPEHWLLTDTIPSLGEARGRLVLLRRYEDEAGLGAEAGIPLLWANQNGYEDLSLNTVREDNGSCTLWVQDRYEYPTEEKWTSFTTGMQEAPTGEGNVAIHFLSTKGTAKFGHPYGFAKDLNPRLTELDGLSGWIVVDFGSAPLAAHIYQANFR